MKFGVARLVRPVAAIAIVGGMAPLALAHTSGNSMATGLSHPLVGLDHLLALLGVGLWASRFEGRAKWVLPVVFVVCLLAGSLLGFANMSLPAVEPVIAASVLVFGLATLPRVQAAPVYGALLAGLFAVFHGHAHGYEYAGAGPTAFALGMSLTSALVIGAAALGGTLLFRAPHPWLGRAAGIGISIGGAMLMAG